MPNIRCRTDFDRSVFQLGCSGSHKFSFRSPLAYDFGLLLFWPQTRQAMLQVCNSSEKLASAVTRE